MREPIPLSAAQDVGLDLNEGKLDRRRHKLRVAVAASALLLTACGPADGSSPSRSVPATATGNMQSGAATPEATSPTDSPQLGALEAPKTSADKDLSRAAHAAAREISGMFAKPDHVFNDATHERVALPDNGSGPRSIVYSMPRGGYEVSLLVNQENGKYDLDSDLKEVDLIPLHPGESSPALAMGDTDNDGEWTFIQDTGSSLELFGDAVVGNTGYTMQAQPAGTDPDKVIAIFNDQLQKIIAAQKS